MRGKSSTHSSSLITSSPNASLRPLHPFPGSPADHGHRQRHARFFFRWRSAIYSAEHAIAHALQLHRTRAQTFSISAANRRAPARSRSASRRSWTACCRCWRVCSDCGVPLSVDTCKPEVMRAAIQRRRGHDQRCQCAARRRVPCKRWLIPDVAVCLMHMQGEPHTMQHDPRYQDVVAEVKDFSGGAYCGGGSGRHRAASAS